MWFFTSSTLYDNKLKTKITLLTYKTNIKVSYLNFVIVKT